MNYYKIREFEGIGPDFALKLEKAGITTTEHLLEKAGDAKSRSTLAEITAISEPLITKWVGAANLMRVQGISKRSSDLLLAVGVDSTDKLLTFHPKDLINKMEELNKIKKLVPEVPKFTEVEQWQTELRTPEFAKVK
jgi:predicted RecB family nuclease